MVCLLCVCVWQNDLRANRELKVFKLGPEETSRSLIFTDDYRKHVMKVMTELKLDAAVIG